VRKKCRLGRELKKKKKKTPRKRRGETNNSEKRTQSPQRQKRKTTSTIPILTSSPPKQGLDLHEPDSNPTANTSGFFPLLALLLDYPYPTLALLTGHTFGGACPLALAHDYRVMNSQRGYFSMPPINLGLHFPGIGSLLRLKLTPAVRRKMLMEAYKWTGEEALRDGIVDFVAPPEAMMGVALGVAREWAPKARMGVYALLRGELYGEAGRGFRDISYVYGRKVGEVAKAKI